MERAQRTTETHATGHDERTRFDEAWSELDHALTSGGLDAATEAARRRWFDLLEGPVPRRTDALRRLPPAALRGRPLLTLLLGHNDPAVLSHRVGGLRRVSDSASGVVSSPRGRTGTARTSTP